MDHRSEYSPHSCRLHLEFFDPVELYRLGSGSYASGMASRSNQANVEIILLVMLVILVIITALSFLM